MDSASSEARDNSVETATLPLLATSARRAPETDPLERVNGPLGRIN